MSWRLLIGVLEADLPLVRYNVYAQWTVVLNEASPIQGSPIVA